MISENKNQDKKSASKGLNNEVQQNRGINQDRYPSKDSYEKKSFSALINRLAKRRQQTSEEIHEEIMNWPSNKK